MTLKRSIKRVASFVRVGVDFERLKMMYKDNPEDLELRKAYFKECLRRNEGPKIYINWVKEKYGLDIDLNSGVWNFVKTDLNHTDFLSGLYVPKLERLDLSHNSIKSLKGLSNFDAPNLKSLDLSYNGIKNLSGISKLKFPNLLTLRLDHNSITSLVNISRLKFPNLLYLILDHNRIESLEGLSDLAVPSNFQYAYVGENPVTDADDFDEQRRRIPFTVIGG